MRKASRRSKFKEVTMVVTQRDYDRAIASGVDPNEALKPGTYQGRRGGFLERHARDLASGKIETKAGTYIKPDLDVLRFFKRRASKAKALPDHAQINDALRAFIRGAKGSGAA